MKSKTTERILSETPQETKDKVRTTTDRHIQLLKFGFKKNEDQQTYILSKSNNIWYVDFWEVEELDGYEWSVLIDDLTYSLTKAKNHWFDGLREHPAYNFAKKEFKKEILDNLNKYRAQLQQETQCKMGRGNPNLIKETELRAKIKVLQELLKQQKPQE